jgi:hypothetical protein
VNNFCFFMLVTHLVKTDSEATKASHTRSPVAHSSANKRRSVPSSTVFLPAVSPVQAVLNAANSFLRKGPRSDPHVHRHSSLRQLLFLLLFTQAIAGTRLSHVSSSFRIPSVHDIINLRRQPSRYCDWLRAGWPRGRNSYPDTGKNFSL